MPFHYDRLKQSKLLSVWAVVWELLILGPFGLPFLWLSPKFRTATKILLTILVILLTLLLSQYTVVLLGDLQRQLNALKQMTV